MFYRFQSWSWLAREMPFRNSWLKSPDFNSYPTPHKAFFFNVWVVFVYGYIKLHFATTRSVPSPFSHQNDHSFFIWRGSHFPETFPESYCQYGYFKTLMGSLGQIVENCNFFEKFIMPKMSGIWLRFGFQRLQRLAPGAN